MNKKKGGQPQNVKVLHRESRRFHVRELAASLEATGSGHDPGAWSRLLLYAVNDDPDIPESAKRILRSRIILTMQGRGSVDLRSPEKRAAEWSDEDIYRRVMGHGAGAVAAFKAVGQALEVPSKSIEKAYYRHLKRWPHSRRLDGRKKKK